MKYVHVVVIEDPESVSWHEEATSTVVGVYTNRDTAEETAKALAEENDCCEIKDGMYHWWSEEIGIHIYVVTEKLQ